MSSGWFKPIQPPRTTSLDQTREAELILATIETLGEFTSDHEWEQEISRTLNLEDVDKFHAHDKN